MLFRLVEDAAPAQLAFLAPFEVETAGYTAGTVAFGPQDEDRHQDENAHDKGCGDDPFHGGLVAGGAGLVILPGRSPFPLRL